MLDKMRNFCLDSSLWLFALYFTLRKKLNATAFLMLYEARNKALGNFAWFILELLIKCVFHLFSSWILKQKATVGGFNCTMCLLS